MLAQAKIGILRSSAVCVVMVAAAGCQGMDVTRSIAKRPTLRVTNASCERGRCDSMIVLGFPADGPITPGGLWSINLGLLTTPTGCITLLRADTARVRGPGSDGIVRTTLYIWTPAKSLSLGSVAPAQGRFGATPTTAEFVPANAAGWRATLPGSEVVSDSDCAP